jgi:hypothetical protein
MRERKPRVGRKSLTDFVAKARAAWGDAQPDWVAIVAEEANRTSVKAVADRIGRSSALVSNVIANKYPGDMAAVEELVRGALMGATVACPVLGEIGLLQCLAEQGKPFSATSSVRSRLYRACRGGCPHSRITAVREKP